MAREDALDTCDFRILHGDVMRYWLRARKHEGRISVNLFAQRRPNQ